MSQPFNENLRRLLRLTREMMALADEGDHDRNDDSCGIIYGILRDSAYRLRGIAELECDKHRRAGKWDDGDDGLREESPGASSPSAKNLKKGRGPTATCMGCGSPSRHSHRRS